MKNIIFFMLLPVLSFAQPKTQNFTVAEIKAISDAAKQGEEYKRVYRECLIAADNLKNQIFELSDKTTSAANQISALNSEINALQAAKESLQQEYYKLEKKAAKRKYVAFGPAIIITPEPKIYGAISATYILFSL